MRLLKPSRGWTKSTSSLPKVIVFVCLFSAPNFFPPIYLPSPKPESYLERERIAIAKTQELFGTRARAELAQSFRTPNVGPRAGASSFKVSSLPHKLFFFFCCSTEGDGSNVVVAFFFFFCCNVVKKAIAIAFFFFAS